MLRIPSVLFGSGSHEIEGAAFLRSQLWGAELAPADGETPTLSALIDELVTIATISRADGRLPFEHRKADVPFRSLSGDLAHALDRLGPRLARLVGNRLATIIDPNWPRGDEAPSPPWSNLFAHGEAIGEQLQTTGALIAAFDDALEAAGNRRSPPCIRIGSCTRERAPRARDVPGTCVGATSQHDRRSPDNGAHRR